MDELTQRIEAAKKELIDAHAALFSVIEDAEKGLVRIDIGKHWPGAITTLESDPEEAVLVARVNWDDEPEFVYARHYSLLFEPEFVPEVREHDGRYHVVVRRRGGAND